MTFSSPYTGVFAYKGILPSSVMNNINNNIPNCLDKTGDWTGNGGGITGTIEFLGGSELLFASLSQIQMESNTQITIFNGANITFNANSNLILSASSTAEFSGLTVFEDSSVTVVDSPASFTFNSGAGLALGGTSPAVAFPSFVNNLNRSYIQPISTGVPQGGLWSYALNGIQEDNGPSAGGSLWQTNLRTHDGAELSNVVFNYIINSTHSDPGSGSRIILSVYTVSENGTESNIASVTLSGNGYYTSGNHSVTLSCNATITNSSNYYVAQILNETGSSSIGNIFTTIQLNFTNIASSIWSQ